MTKRTKHTLEGFRAHLADHGIGETSIACYVSDVALAQKHGGPIARLRNDELAPKSRRRYLAAFRHWAEYTGDEDLRKSLAKVRLPSPRRKVAKVPLERDAYDRVLDEINAADYLPSDAMRGVLGLLAFRGLRCGDALRLRREEVADALDKQVLSYEAKGKRRLEFRLLRSYTKYLKILHKAFDGEPKAKRVDELVSPRSKPKSRAATAERAVERALTRLGVRVGVLGLFPHRLRRTYAVEYLRQMKGDPEALVKLTKHMQWAEMSTALEYVDYVHAEDLDAAAERMFERPEKAGR